MRRLLILLSAFLLLSACQLVSQAPLHHETISITDSFGSRQVRVNPKRVAVFSMDILDIIDTIGLEHFEIDLLGLPQESVPANLNQYKDKAYKNVGTLFEVNYDAMDLFDPQLIILSGRLLPLTAELQSKYPDADILDVSLPDYSLKNGLVQNVNNLAQIFPQVSERLHANLEVILQAMADIAHHTQKIEALFLLVNANTISYYGPKGRFGVVYNEFNYTPADHSDDEGGTHGKSVSFEYVLEIDPDVIFLMDRGASIGDQATLDDVKNNDVIKQTQAAQHGAIYSLDPIAWYITTGGFQASMTMIHDMQQALDEPIHIPNLP